MRDYANYVFDLYGTLVDVRTDENKPSLWRFMSDFYAVYGCLLDPEALRLAFWRTDASERAALPRRSPLDCPEIRIERVFLRLLFETPSRPSAAPLAGHPVDFWRRWHARDPEPVLQTLLDGDWAVAAANAFRIHSRDVLRPFPDTLPTLRELLRRGKRLFLLSNAQAVFTLPELALTGLLDFFPVRRISSETGVMKPQREFLESLLRGERLDPRETVVVGNEMQSDVAVAIRCGVDAVYLNTSHLPPDALREEALRLLASESAPLSSMPVLLPSGRLRDLLP